MHTVPRIILTEDFVAHLDADGQPVIQLRSDPNSTVYPLDHPAVRAMVIERLNDSGKVSEPSVTTYIELLAAKAYREGRKPVTAQSDPYAQDTVSAAVYSLAKNAPDGSATYENTLRFRDALVEEAAKERIDTSEWTKALQWFSRDIVERTGALSVFGVALGRKGKSWMLRYDPPEEVAADEQS